MGSWAVSRVVLAGHRLGISPGQPSSFTISYITNVAYIANVRAGQSVGDVGYLCPVAGETIDPYADEPLYAQLAAILRARIERGELQQLDRIPPESSLVQEYGVSRDTARKAIETLRNEGVVFTVPHRGTYVGPRPERQK